MKNIFSFESRHTVTEANTNFYAVPFVHPKRKMDEHDFIYLVHGEWKIGQNNEVFTLKNDTLLILSGKNTHYGVEQCSKGTKTMYFHTSCEEGDCSGKECDKNPHNGVCVNTFTDVSGSENIKNIFCEIVNSKLSGNQRKADVCFELLLCELSQVREPHFNSGIEEQIKNIIHNSPERFFSNGELAAAVNVSVKTAEMKFKKAIGMTIHQYILKFKAEQAVAYFKNFPRMSIKEIAYNLGFYDEYHFSKQFRRITGLSPKHYKNQL